MAKNTKLKKGKKLEETKPLTIVSPRDASGGLPTGKR
jgi:hypothetical protein